MHREPQKSAFLMTLLAVLLTLGPATADSGLYRGSQLEEMADYYGEINGDRDAWVTLNGLRGLTRLDSGLGGHTRFNLIDGEVIVSLRGVKSPLDVWALDNQPAEGSSFLPEAQDRLVLVARVERDGEQRIELGKEAFRGFELDRVLVVPAGADPLSAELLLIGGRSGYARRFTQKRLAAEGFELPRRPPRTTPDRGASAGPALGNKATSGVGFATSPHHLLVTRGLVSQTIFDGGEIFFREEFNGNGRSCGTCHPAEHNQVVDPAFLAEIKPSCDLTNPNLTGVCGIFVAETRSSSDPISQLEKPDLMNANALILENVDGFKSPGEFFMMRSVTHSLSLGTSFEPPPPGTPPEGPPAPDLTFSERTGWSGDGAPNASAGIPPGGGATGSFRDFVTGAIMQHYPNHFFELPDRLDTDPNDGDPANFRFADDDELDDVEAFLKNTGRINDIVLANIDFVDNPAFTPPNLIDFVNGQFDASACGTCHGNAGANGLADFDGDGDRDDLGNRLFDTGVERLPNPNQAILPFPLDCGNGGGGSLEACQPGETTAECGDFDVDNDGVTDCFGNGMFNVTPIIEAADTGPWFHTNTAVSLFADLSDGVQMSEVTTGAAQTIEDAIMFYNTDEFNNSPGGQFMISIGLGPIALDTNQVIGTGAFLRALNGAFNVAQAQHRNDAALTLSAPGLSSTTQTTTSFPTSEGVKGTVNKLLSLSNAELEDALEVLNSPFLGPLFPGSTSHLQAAIDLNNQVIATTSEKKRTSLMQDANAEIAAAAAAISNIQFQMGDANLLF